MPKNTFLRLRKEKHNAFVKEAMKEFAAHDYEAASVSNIVRSLGIAKGSIYQYFEDKWELYTYLIKTAHNDLLEVVHLVDSRINQNAALWFVQRVLVEIKFSKQLPDESTLLLNLKANSHQSVKALTQLLEQKEIDLIEKVLSSIIDKPADRALAITVYAVKNHYVKSLDPGLSHQDIAGELNAFANIIFNGDQHLV